MKIRTMALTLALAASPAVLAAQGGGQWQGPQRGQQGPRGQLGRQGGAFQALLAHREQLRLSGDQVSRIQALQQRLESQNRPLMQRIQALRQQSGLPDFRAQRRDGQGMQGRRPRGQRPQLTEQQRQRLQQFRRQVQPMMQQIRQNQQAAMQQLRSVLNDQQKQQLRRFHRHQQRARMRRGRGMRGRRPGMQRPFGAPGYRGA